MPNSAISRLTPVNRLRVAIAGLVMLACGIGIAVLAFDVMTKINSAAAASTDNVQWALSQVDVELLRLVMAVDSAEDSGDLAEVRLRYDVFYSRIETLQRGGVFAELRQSQLFNASFARVREVIRQSQPLIDGPDAGLAAGLDGLSRDLHGILGNSRIIALTGVEVFAAISDARRAGVERTLIIVGALTIVLVTTLVGMLGMLLRLYRGNRLRAAENLETLSRFNAVVATALDAVITVDGSGRIVDFNAAASTTFGYSRAEAMQAAMADLVLPGPQDRALFRPGAAPEVSAQGRVRVSARHKDGHVFPAEIAITSSTAGSGLLYVVFLRDLSAQVAAEQELVRARDDALAGEKAKADLLVVMSHEIRTPLNGMIGTIELLDTTELQPNQREYLRIMAASGRLLMHHVNDVLDIARLDSGKAPLTLRPVDLVELAGEVIDNQTPAARANGNQLMQSGPEDGRSLVIADAAQLRQVLLNLVGNAVKFTQYGGITIAIAHRSSHGPTEITVSDTGIGIAEADLDRIFDDFVTLDPSYSRRATGTGLGLGIVRRIVARMGGALSVDSREGLGSTFRISLPLTILSAPAEPLVTKPPAGSRRPLVTLVVEDNDFNRVITRDMLVKAGHEVVEARDGAEGIACAAARRFDLILMDISMPDTDGLQAAQAIRSGSGASRDTPIVALTAHALREETERFRAGGMQQILVKPVTRDALNATIAAALGVEDRMTAAVPTLINREVFDTLAEDLGPERTEDLVGKFLDDTRAGIEALVRDAATGADAAILREVHRLEGSAGMFGAAALHDRLTRIETLCKAGDSEAARALMPDLAVLWRDTERAYRAGGVLPQLSSLR